MCNICFPTCGRCRPVSIVTFACPECGKPDSTTREGYLMHTGRPHKLADFEKMMHEENAGRPLRCKECGCDLTETLQQRVIPASCKRSQILCGFPCGRRVQDADPENPCSTMVPMGDYREEAAF